MSHKAQYQHIHIKTKKKEKGWRTAVNSKNSKFIEIMDSCDDDNKHIINSIDFSSLPSSPLELSPLPPLFLPLSLPPSTDDSILFIRCCSGDITIKISAHRARSLKR